MSVERQNQSLDYLTSPSFRGVNRLLALLFENNDDRTEHTRYFLPAVQIKDYNVMVDGENYLDQTVKIDLKACNNI